jgi:uncharacterized protein (DUF1501 family)
VLVLLELRGGNDGLNTVAPVRDPLYQQARPTLALRDGLPWLKGRAGSRAPCRRGQLPLHGRYPSLRELDGRGDLIAGISPPDLYRQVL